MNKKGSLTSRTLEKLGFVTARFRSNSQPTNPDDLTAKESLIDPDKPQTTVNTITAGELDIPDKPHKKTLLDRLFGQKNGQEETNSQSTFYVDTNTDKLETLTTNREPIVEPIPTAAMLEKKKKVKPEGTFEYKAEDSDTLEKIAARFDTTPSELKKLNKLISSMIFAGQVIFVPDKDYVPVRTSSVSETDKQKSPTSPTQKDKSPDRPTMDVPLVKAANEPPAKVPGHVERQVLEDLSNTEFEMVPHKLTEDEAEMLDKECMERFIKLNVKHITDGQLHIQDPKKGVVKGVLLVTPNAVMFDPDVMDPLVIERGADKYGLIAPMDIIISAAMYHDISAMKLRDKKQEDGTSYPKPEVYHDPHLPSHPHTKTDTTKDATKDTDFDIPHTSSRSSKLEKTIDECSCGTNVLDTENSDKNKSESVSMEYNQGRLSDAIDNAEKDSKSDNDNDVFETLPDTSKSDSQQTNQADKTDSVQRRPSKKGGKKLSVSFSVPESDDVNLSDKVNTEGEAIVEELDGSSVTKGDNEPELQSDNKDTKSENLSKLQGPESAISELENDEQSGDKAIKSQSESAETKKQSKELDQNVATGSEEASNESDTKEQSDDKETRIGNIRYLPLSENQNGEITVESLEHTQNTLAKLSSDEFKDNTNTDSVDAAQSASRSDNTDEDKTGSMVSNALGPFSPTPHINAFVNYATGFFQRHAQDNIVKDVKDMSSSKQGEEGSRTSDIPTIGVTPREKKRVGKMSRHDNLADIEVENAVRMDEKSDLFTMDYKRFGPRKSVLYPDPPLYLCLRLGTPNKTVFHNYSIESYGKRRKKSEYWFSIPREKVDHLYAFFVQWTPEIYGDEDDLNAEKRGFVVIQDNEDGDEDSIGMLDEHFGPNSEFQKDWEIISKFEAERRRSIVYHEPLPLPDLIGNSVILDEEKISLLCQVMPGRTVGYPWTLVYSTETHGFSLKTLYRVMHDLDSPILLAVKDISENVFGALTLCQLKVSDSFYGTGESFLYTFYPEFKVFGALTSCELKVSDSFYGTGESFLYIFYPEFKVFGALTSCELKVSDSFYGTGESFLYTFYPEFKVFNWTGENNFFMKGNNESLSVGAGQGVFGLWFDGDIYHGRSNQCETFNNDILTIKEDFIVGAFEAWAFIWD